MRKGEVKENKGRIREFLAGAMAMLTGMMVLTAPILVSLPVMADGCDGVETAVLGNDGCFETDDNGGGIVTLLQSVADIMTGIVGGIGITWAGIQYLTAGGSEEKTRIAKRRMYEIVIGLVAYVLIYVILRWLLPGFGT